MVNILKFENQCGPTVSLQPGLGIPTLKKVIFVLTLNFFKGKKFVQKSHSELPVIAY